MKFTLQILLGSLLAAASASHAAQPESYDLIIRGGRVVDGAGNGWFRADVALQGDTIAAIGRLDGATARRVIEARDAVVAPGFIDAHSHARRMIFEETKAENYIRQGVTTAVEGPDGSSPLPLKPFFDKLAAARIAINMGALVAQGSVREQVIGIVNRRATPDEIEKMKELVKQAMEDGALGLSTGLFYVPGNYTPTEEVIELAKVAGRMGGVHTSHMRDEAAGVLKSVEETIAIGERGGLPPPGTPHKIIRKRQLGAERGYASVDRRGAGARRGRDHRSISLHRFEHGACGAAAAMVAGRREERDRQTTGRSADARADQSGGRRKHQVRPRRRRP